MKHCWIIGETSPWLFVTLIFCFWIQGLDASKSEESLLKHLFNGYNSKVRPVLNDTDAVEVTFGLSVSQIIDVVWMNPFLSWNSSDFNNITHINVQPKEIWLPDIVLYNNADEDKSFGGNLDRLNTRVILRHDGQAKWLAPVLLKSKCPINVKYFPFDEQHCKMKFGSWTYDAFRLNLTRENNTADIKKYLPNAEWKLINIPAVRNEAKYECCAELYPDVTYTVIVKRRSLFYLINLIFPMTMIGMLTMLSFLLPAESGERISLAITLLLAMTVFMLVVADIIPATSEVIPLVGIFFSAAMVEMVIMIIILCYTMQLYHKEPDDPPMPWWMRKYLLDWLAYKVKMRKRKRFVGRTATEYVQMLPVQRRNSISDGSASAKEDENREIQLWVRNTLPRKSPNCQTELKHCKHFNTSERSSSRNSELGSINKKLDVIVGKIRSDEEDSQTKNEWRIIAMTIDRCLLYVFIVLLLLTIAICFSNSPGYVS